MLERQIKNLIASYLDGEISLNDFRERFGAQYLESRGGPAGASGLCNQVVGPLAELSRGHRSESSLKSILALVVEKVPSGDRDR